MTITQSLTVEAPPAGAGGYLSVNVIGEKSPPNGLTSSTPKIKQESPLNVGSEQVPAIKGSMTLKENATKTRATNLPFELVVTFARMTQERGVPVHSESCTGHCSDSRFPSLL